jgi:hypothetical protein
MRIIWAGSRENRHVVFCGLSEAPHILALECSNSQGTAVWGMNFCIPNMNKIRPTVQALARDTHMHTDGIRDTEHV